MIPRILSHFESHVPDNVNGIRADVPPETNLLLGERKNGNGYMLIIPLIGGKDINGSGDDNYDGIGFSLGGEKRNPGKGLLFRGHSNKPINHRNSVNSEVGKVDSIVTALLIATGDDPFALINWGLQETRKYIRKQNGVGIRERGADIEESQQLNDFSEIENSESKATSSVVYERGPGPMFVDSFGW
jgi:hypothetical protein